VQKAAEKHKPETCQFNAFTLVVIHKLFKCIFLLFLWTPRQWLQCTDVSNLPCTIILLYTAHSSFTYHC